jgi:predicted dehydrogenase
VALPNAFHQPVACHLLECGIHVLVEKPMARNVEECRQILAAAERGGAIVAVSHNRRFRPNVLAARRLLTQGFIGSVTRIRAEEGSRTDWPRSKAYFDPVQAGGGTLLDVGIHTIDLIRHLVGEFASLQYKGNQTANTVESEAELEFELQCGARGTLLCSRDRNLRNEMVIEGPEGSLTLGLWGQELSLRCLRGKAFRNFPTIPFAPLHRAMDATFVEQLFQFVNAIRDGASPTVDGCEGMKTVAVAEWAYRNANPLAGPNSALVAGSH